MTYSKQTWANGSAGGTPISATRLNYMEAGIESSVQVNEGPLSILDARVGGATGGVVNNSPKLTAARALLPTGGTIFCPPGVYRFDDTMTWTDTRSLVVEGAGMGHAGVSSGTVFRWGGASGGKLFDLAGYNSSSIRRLVIDGVGKSLGTGIHIRLGTNATSQMNVLEELVLANMETAVQFGVTDANEGNNDQCEFRKCWIRDNTVGLLTQGDQSILSWFTGGTQFLNHTGAAIRSGSVAPNGGHMNMIGGYFGANAIDLDLPRLNGPSMFIGLNSENSGEFLKHDGAGGNPERTITLMNVWQNSAAVGATRSMAFKTGNGLVAIGCRFVLPVEVDNLITTVSPPWRTFINTVATVTKMGPTFPYKVMQIGRPAAATSHEGDISFENVEIGTAGVLRAKDSGGTTRTLSRINGSVGVHAGGEVSVSNGATTSLGAASDLTGLLVVRRITSDRVGLFLVHSGTVLEISDPQNVFTTTVGTAAQVNVFVTAGNLTIENLSGSANVFRLALLGASAT